MIIFYIRIRNHKAMRRIEEIIVRSIEQSDAESYYAIFSHPDVARYDDFTPITREELAVDMGRIAKYTPQSAFRELAVALWPSNQMVGVITVDKKRIYTYLGYHFNPAFHGRGLAVRSMAMFVAGLPCHQSERLRVVTHPDNKASISLAQKLGFVFLKNRRHHGVSESVYSFSLQAWETLNASTPSTRRIRNGALQDSNTLASCR